MFEALQKGDPARAEKLARWAVAYDPEQRRGASQPRARARRSRARSSTRSHHLVRGTREQATQILSGVLYQGGKLPEAMAVLDYASRWYVRADQWLTYGGIAYAAMDNAAHGQGVPARLPARSRGVRRRRSSTRYAGVLDEVGDYAACETHRATTSSASRRAT